MILIDPPREARVDHPSIHATLVPVADPVDDTDYLNAHFPAQDNCSYMLEKFKKPAAVALGFLSLYCFLALKSYALRLPTGSVSVITAAALVTTRSRQGTSKRVCQVAGACFLCAAGMLAGGLSFDKRGELGSSLAYPLGAFFCAVSSLPILYWIAKHRYERPLLQDSVN